MPPSIVSVWGSFLGECGVTSMLLYVSVNVAAFKGVVPRLRGQVLRVCFPHPRLRGQVLRACCHLFFVVHLWATLIISVFAPLWRGFRARSAHVCRLRQHQSVVMYAISLKAM